jgi:hypothetical protein
MIFEPPSSKISSVHTSTSNSDFPAYLPQPQVGAPLNSPTYTTPLIPTTAQVVVIRFQEKP